ncbi:RagB/SusD family nutrient uptake outer membrane protein [Sphingobacterium faecale]|uniref:RagB/SusD family nutrient uptake outer membrane protein n=1 Tax=Sphingobacterium faecale TaxID=2803775 RepID=A0ABS1R678_9SPHI|nr:RagB/SusD family nutrient uptake outer membrane protein [Sphingobacterium faecale]MBL1410211.1 RagB/SusD family nutrient uptake outer membrane protein [Sphingobacterium faecale]
MKKIINYVLMVWFTLMLFSCEVFVEIDQPKNQIANPVVFNNETMVRSALNNVYVSIYNSGFLSGNNTGAGYLMGCYTDELEVTTSQNVDYKLFYEGTVSSTTNLVKKIWSDVYKQIFNCNLIIDGVENSIVFSDDFKNQIIGECKVIRGVLHFYLTQTFGNVPYIFTTDYNVNNRVVKMQVHEVMKIATDDLIQAEKLLKSSVLGSERIYINKTVTQAFLARMFLYQENWVKAKEYADKIISNQFYQLEPIENVFLKGSKSAIWQLKPLLAGNNTFEGYFYIFSEKPAPNVQLTKGLLQSFENNDLRRDKWVKIVDEDTKSAHAYKYKMKGTSSPSQEYSIIIRIEEMYLISAEASAELNDFDSTNSYLNAIRNKSGLQSLNVTNSNDAINSILNERRTEFFCEFGHRFYDLKRRNKLSALQTTKPNWKSYFQYWPIPEGELNLNSNLKPQNDGY